MGKPLIGGGGGGWPGPHRQTPGMDFTGEAPGDLSYASSKARLLLETGLNTEQYEPVEDLEWAQITEPLDGEDHTAQLTLPGFDLEKIYNANGTLNEHFAAVLAKLTPDRRVRVIRSTGPVDRRVLFQGYPQMVSLQSTPERRAVTITCLSEAQEWLRHHENADLLGAYWRRNPGAAWDEDNPDHKLLTACPVAFNPEGRPNRSAESYLFKTRDGQIVQLYLWVEPGEPGAGHWSYVQALRSLAYFWVDQGNGPVSVIELLNDTANIAAWTPVPDANEDPFLVKMTAIAKPIALQSVNVDEAMTALCAAAGLHYHVPVRSLEGEGDDVAVDHFVRVLAARVGGPAAPSGTRVRMRMRPPAVHDLPIEPPLSVTTATPAQTIAIRNRVQHLDLTVDRRAINVPTFLGGYREYEGSFLLRPGWEPLAEHHLDNLDVDDAGEPLGPTEAEANRVAARDYWDEEFSTKFDETAQPLAAPTKYHRQHAEHATVADVFRKWIFPDHAGIVAGVLGRKSGPWQIFRCPPFMPAHPENPNGPLSNNLWWNDWTYGGGLLPPMTQHWAVRRRPFGDPISRRNAATTELTPVVRLHFGMKDEDGNFTTATPGPDDPGWIEYTGDVDILEDQAGLHFGESDFHGSPAFRSDPENAWDENRALWAYIWGHFWVQITATVRADRRMIQNWRTAGGSFIRDRGQITDLGFTDFVARARGKGNSYLQGQAEADPQFDSRDDWERFIASTEALAKRITGDTTAGNCETFFLDDSIWPGDSINGCVGLGLRFNRYPVVTCRQHFGGESPRTQLVLTDMRRNPEIGGD